MNASDLLSIASGIAVGFGFIPYIVATVKKTTKPNVATWAIWASLDTLVLLGMIQTETVNGQLVVSVAGAWVVTVLAIIYGTTTWTWVETVCSIGCVIGAIAWQMTADPLVAIWTGTCLIVVGAVPTFLHGWKKPEEENRWAWLLYFIGCVLALLSLKEWTVASALQPISFTLIETTMLAMVWGLPWLRRRRKAPT
ncbi:MAG: hypothetical protein KBC95_03355 [Candidatus Peribacteraceae bacterium]|nr:hypothetical protein [Candidatus Peribacteraceae bacterium]